ncbi:SagB/ThcOx family dehydrogenase [bacterium]|nr:SagB/ThcOx family dehydrogenase [bacterium]
MLLPYFRVATLIFFILVCGVCFCQSGSSGQKEPVVPLPEPRLSGGLSVEAAFNQRRSVRQYSNDALNLTQIGQLCWSAQGVTKKIEKPFWLPEGREWIGGLKTAPSAGALYPLEIYLVIGNADNLSAGLYRYLPAKHALKTIHTTDLRKPLSEAALDQGFLTQAGVVMVITGIYERTAVKYGDRAGRYVHMEVGAVCQNVALQCESLGLSTVVVGAFDDDQISQVLKLPGNEHPLAILPLGKKQ